MASARHVPAAVAPLVGLCRFITVIALVAILLGHLPLHVLYAKRRRGRPMPKGLPETIALGSAMGTACLCFLAAASDAAGRILAMLAGDQRLHVLAVCSIPFYVFVVLLVAFFIYYWQNHCIRIIYAPYIFTRPGFVRSSRRLRRKTIPSQIIPLVFSAPSAG